MNCECMWCRCTSGVCVASSGPRGASRRRGREAGERGGEAEQLGMIPTPQPLVGGFTVSRAVGPPRASCAPPSASARVTSCGRLYFGYALASAHNPSRPAARPLPSIPAVSGSQGPPRTARALREAASSAPRRLRLAAALSPPSPPPAPCLPSPGALPPLSRCSVLVDPRPDPPRFHVCLVPRCLLPYSAS